jgi:hypothetical protein
MATYSPDEVCPLCQRQLQADDEACRQCSDESVERILAPFLLLQHKKNTTSETEVQRTKSVLYRPGHNPEKDPAWVELRTAAKKHWPDLNAVDDDIVIATRVDKWIDEQRPSVSELQRPLVSVSTVISLFATSAMAIERSVAGESDSNEVRTGNQPDFNVLQHGSDPISAGTSTEAEKVQSLMDNEREILEILREKKATEQVLVKQKVIAPLIDEFWTEENVKAPMARLSALGFVGGRKGRSGGNWITSDGLQRLKDEKAKGWKPKYRKEMN